MGTAKNYPSTNLSNLPHTVSHLLKTSDTHPLNISWIFPSSCITEKCGLNSSHSIGVFQKYSNGIIFEKEDSTPEIKYLRRNSEGGQKGNLALCSVPGKKVRLDGVNVSFNRVPIWRDLNVDMRRIKSLNFSTIVNLLDDEEMELVGAPFEDYLSAASLNKLTVIR
jgi:hypothetical protein